jgi:general secretion pathway protein B
MSYILDALKKSDQERQQGASPHLYSVHSSAPAGRNFSPVQLHYRLWLLVGGVLFILAGLGILLFLNRQIIPPANLAPELTTSLEQPADPAAKKVAGPDAKQTIKQATDKKDTLVPQVVIKENNVVLRSVALKDTTLPQPRIVTTNDQSSSVPLLQDLSDEIRAAVPELKFAGHTYSDDPFQRMIIVNGQILREGDTIAADTHLLEITWEGVVVDFKGTHFLVKTN